MVLVLVRVGTIALIVRSNGYGFSLLARVEHAFVAPDYFLPLPGLFAMLPNEHKPLPACLLRERVFGQVTHLWQPRRRRCLQRSRTASLGTSRSQPLPGKHKVLKIVSTVYYLVHLF